MADNEKRIKLGVDIGELGNQLVQINNLTEQNYNLAIQGQSKYNDVLMDSLTLLDTQTTKLKDISDLVEQIMNNSQNINIDIPSVPPNQQNGSTEQDNTELIASNELLLDSNLDLIDSVESLIKSNDTLFQNLTAVFQQPFFGPPLPFPDPNQNGGGGSGGSSSDDQIDYTEQLDKIILREGNIQAGIELLIDPLLSLQDTTMDILTEIQKPQSQRGGAGGGGGNGNNPNNPNGSNNGGGGGSNAGDTFNRGAGFAMQKNEVYMLAAATAMIPVVGQGVSMVLQRLLKAAEDLDNSAHGYYAVSGNYSGLGNFNNIGLSTAEAYQKQQEYIRYNVNLRRSDLEFEKGFGISGGGMSSLLQATRNDVSGNNPNSPYHNETGLGSSELGARYLSYLTANVKPNQVRAYSEDYLKILVDINQQQLEAAGYTNSLINGQIITGIAGLSDAFKDPIVLQKMVTGLRDGLTQASSPQLEALQFITLSQSNPNASLWDLQKARENPFDAPNSDYLANYINNLMNIGSEDEAKFNIKSAFNLPANLVEELVNGIKEKSANGEQFYGNDYQDIVKRFNIQNEAATATSAMQQLTARTEDLMAEIGTPVMNLTLKAEKYIMDAVNKVMEVFGGASSGIGDFISSVGNATGVVDKFATAVAGASNIPGSFIGETGKNTAPMVPASAAAQIITNQKSTSEKLQAAQTIGFINSVMMGKRITDKIGSWFE